MSRPNKRLDLGSILAAAILAPPLSVLIALFISFVLAFFDGGLGQVGVVGVIGATLFMMVIVAVWGLIPSLVFGAAGAWLAGRYLGSKPLWVWGLIGMTSAGAYVLVSLGLAVIAPAAAFMIAPWAAMNNNRSLAAQIVDPTMPLIISAILLAGSAAGVLYRRFLLRSMIVWKTHSPLTDFESFDPDLSNGADKPI